MIHSIEQLPEHEVASFRHVGSYVEAPAASWEKLMQWAIPNGLFPPQQRLIGISLDNPETTAADACRHEACVTLPAGFAKELHPGVQFRTLPGGLYALHRFYDTADQLAVAYREMFGNWLPASEYEADEERHCLEFSLNNPADDPEGKCKVDLYVPVRKRD